MTGPGGRALSGGLGPDVGSPVVEGAADPKSAGQPPARRETLSSSDARRRAAGRGDTAQDPADREWCRPTPRPPPSASRALRLTPAGAALILSSSSIACEVGVAQRLGGAGRDVGVVLRGGVD